MSSDAFSDAILDSILAQDNESHVACESLATKGLVVISGEVRTNANIDVEKVVKDTVKEVIGYDKNNSGVDPSDIEILSKLHAQSPEIAQGVDSEDLTNQGAGDQGLMFGYACKETPELMPLPIQISHRLTEKLTDLRKSGDLEMKNEPDGKSQVSVAYENGSPTSIEKTVIATQHDDMVKEYGSEASELKFVEKEVINRVIKPVLDSYGYPYSENFIVNGTGRFVYGGPEADTGLTGRKIIVDTYGGYAPHGGGAFSGKDPSKVDRSATYMARYIAKNMVAADLADHCEVQLSYGIGVAEPTSFYVKTNGTGKKDDELLTKLARELFPLRPGEIVAHLDLKKQGIEKQLPMVILEGSLKNLHRKKLTWLKPFY